MPKMSQQLKDLLSSEGVSPEIVGSLEAAMVNASSASLEAGLYADHVETSFDLYGLEGVKTQVLYMLCNLRNWQGEEARNAKKVLKKFSKS